MVTIKDIADAAGVSATTVSNVVHGYTGRVSKKTAERIQEIIEQSGYIPNLSARSLVSRTSHVIALIFHHNMVSSKDIIIDPFDYLAISQIEASMRESGYYMVYQAMQAGMTGLCVAVDQLAIALISGLRYQGVVLPDQLSMVGFGDLQQCILPKPKLTSIRCDMSLKANLAVEYMKSLLNGTRTEAVHTLIPVSLVERESVRYI